jgi:hypothetical protein
VPKYTHYITVPFTSSVEVIIESDEKIEDEDQAYDMAMDQIYKSDPCIDLENKGKDRDKNAVEMGEELEYHKELNRGNVCHAVCPEISWTTEKEDE